MSQKADILHGTENKADAIVMLPVRGRVYVTDVCQ